MAQTTKRKVNRNPNRTKAVAPRWLLVKEETWAKVERLTQRMQADQTAYGFKLTVNRVASMEFERAISEIKE